jgi:hypothetical protein
MIPKSGFRFLEKIMTPENIDTQPDLAKPDQL